MKARVDAGRSTEESRASGIDAPAVIFPMWEESMTRIKHAGLERWMEERRDVGERIGNLVIFLESV